MSQLFNENSESGKKKPFPAKEQSLSEQLTNTGGDNRSYALEPVTLDSSSTTARKIFSKNVLSTELPAVTSRADAEPTGPVYAGFFRRYFAVIIDDAILYCLNMEFLFVSIFAEGVFLHFLPRILDVNFSGQMFDFVEVTLCGLVFLIACLFTLLYSVVLESSDMEGTFGKKLLGMRVADTSGNRLTFAKSIRKAMVPGGLLLASILAFGLGTGAAIINISVVPVVFWFISLAALLCGFFGNFFFINKRNQTLHDLLSHRVVLRRVRPAQADRNKTFLKLLPLEKKFVIFALAGIPVFLCELLIMALCHVQFAPFSPPIMTLNKSGHVLITKREVKAGSLLKPEDCYQADLPLYCTPPFALDGKERLDHVLVLNDIKPDDVVTYGAALPKAFAITEITSIEPLPDSNHHFWRSTQEPPEHIARNVSADRLFEAFKNKYPFVKWVSQLSTQNLSTAMFKAPDDEIRAALKLSRESNADKKYSVSLDAANHAIALLLKRFRHLEGNQTEAMKETKETKETKERAKADQSLASSRPLPKSVKLVALPVEFRAAMGDILLEKAIAEAGLEKSAFAKVDADNCIRLLRSLNEGTLVTRMDEYKALPAVDDSVADYTSAANDSDSKDTDSNRTEAKDAESKLTAAKGAEVKAGDSQSDNSPDAGSTSAAKDFVNKQAERYLDMLTRSDQKRFSTFLNDAENRLKSIR
jgi:uncharacterized RDD family membrane protein YckC